MALGLPEGLLLAFVPVVVYWITSGIYHFLLRSKEDSRLFTKEEEDTKNLATRRQVLVGVLVNQTVQAALATIVFPALEGDRGAAADAPRTSWLGLAKQLAVATLIMDTWGYFWHRWTHENEFMMKHVHGMHHRLVVPYSYGAQYIHPIDSLFGEVVSGILATYISGMSPQTAAVYFGVVALKGVDDHCGHWFPESNPIHRFIPNNTATHTVHHQNHGFKHNYSLYYSLTWDMLLGTYLPYTVQQRKGGGYQIHTPKDD